VTRYEHRDTAYELRQLLQGAVRPLRDAEDLARLRMPAWPTADRIRDIYEQIGDDLLNGRSSVPPLKQRLREADAEVDRLRTALLSVAAFSKHPHPAPCGHEPCVLCLIESTAAEALEFGASS
jgi:hypothetical protein